MARLRPRTTPELKSNRQLIGGYMSVKIIVNGMATIKNVPPHILKKMKQDLTIENPKAVQAKKYSKYACNLDEELPLYIQRGSASIIVPRGYLNRAIFHIQKEEYEVIDNTVCPKFPSTLKFNGKLRDYQELCVQDCTKRRYGILEAATGSGKTVMALATIPMRNTTTLILVHNTELLYQWRERIKTFLGIECGLLGDGNNSVKGITVGIINSVVTRAEDLANKFGYVVYDECHRAVGGMWLDTINTLRPKYHLGCTATPFRSDGTTRALYAIIGPKFHVVDKGMLEETGAISIPRIVRLRSDSYIPWDTSTYQYSNFVSHIATDVVRNAMIAKAVVQEYNTYKDPILVVSDRVEHCEMLTELINSYENMNVLLLHGKVKKSERKTKVDKFKKGHYNVLVATVSLIGEGFDSPSLGAIFLTTPIKFTGRLIQTIGRILRPSGTEKPRVYDIRDPVIDVFKYSGFARDRMYKSNGWE